MGFRWNPKNKRTIVVLHGPSNFDMQNWINAVPGLIHAWYPGENGGLALGEILFGDVNPSGKLPVTMERHLQDNPTTANYPLTSDASTIQYTEGIFVGYRGYVCQGIDNEYDGEGLDLSFKFEDQGLAVLEQALILPEYQDELIQNVVGQRRTRLSRNFHLDMDSLIRRSVTPI